MIRFLMTKSYRPTNTVLNDIRQDITLDASNQVLGRIAVKIASILRGKHKPVFTPGTDCGDNVRVINTSEIAVTGKKLKQKMFYKHTGYIGNMKSKSLEERMNKDPNEVIITAVRRMLPKGPLGRAQLKRLKAFTNGISKGGNK